jgi:oligoendopeptidase F
MFVRIDPTFAQWFRRIRSLGLLDLDSRKGKAPGGYQSTLAEARLPYIFMNAAGLDRDLRILLHESGHAFHVLASAPLPLKNDREPPVEFCEVASMSMELFGNACLDEFYSAEEARRSQKRHLEEIVRLLSWVAVVDAFQQWIYTRPGHGKNERRRAWSAICRRLGGDPADWSGLEHYFETLWHRQIHVFQHPFYYIEYAIAQLGALMFWKGYRRDPEKTLLRYRKSLARGGTLTLPELFGEAGLEFDFSERAVSPLVSMIETELARLDGKTGREPHHGESVSSVSGKTRRPEETGRT